VTDSAPGAYARAAETYFDLGLPQVIPVDDDKQPRVDSHHGRSAEPVTRALIAEWSANGLGDSGIAAVLPAAVICADVDDYEGHAGGATLDRLEAELGPLPATIRSTARWGLGSGRSGIRWFAIPGEYSGARWPGKAGPGLDIIVATNRYVIIPPTMHAGVGAPYRWFDEATGRELHSGDLDFTALPELPERWAEFLAKGGMAAPAIEVPDIRAWLEGNGAGDACAYLTGITDHYITEIGEAKDEGGLHDSAAEGINAVLGELASGHPGASAEIARMRKAFLAATSGRGMQRQRQARAEWARMVAGDVPKIAARGIADDHPCDLATMEFRPRYAGEVTLAAYPDYPLDAIDGPLRNLLEEAGNLPAALLGGAGLGALAGLAANAVLDMPDGSQQRPVLWIPLISPRGGGKTPSMQAAFRTFRELDHDAYRDYHREISAWKSRKSQGPRPLDTTMIIDDFTMELLARFLDHGDGTAVAVADELSGFISAFGQYKQRGQQQANTDVARMLSIWAGQPWRYQRVRDDIDLLISRPVVPVVGGIQPSRHGDLGDDETGLRARWLPHISMSTGVRWAESPIVPRDWDDAVAELHDLRSEHRHWIMSGQARRMWREASDRWTEAALSADVTTHGALDKADQQTARIALVLAEADAPGAGQRIPARVMEMAITLMEYVLGCWAAMPAQDTFMITPHDRTVRPKVMILLEWLEQQPEREATRREIMHSHVAGVRTPADADMLILEYRKTFPGTVRQGSRSDSIIVRAPDRA
jgi:hypothetical protein